jgi:predicted Rossmann fold nucleotide-binding protein DprA/Smf involved in DNA uptake
MNTYELTFKCPNKETFIEMIEKIGPIAGTMQVNVNKIVKELSIGDNTQSPYKLRSKPTRMRSSKVNDTIIASLQNGPLSAKELKQGLEDAGLAAGSLSTGLAALQKNRVIERVSEGVYGLVGYSKAAE